MFASSKLIAPVFRRRLSFLNAPFRCMSGGTEGLSSSVADLPADAPSAIYLDMQATTPVDPRVLDAMMPSFLDEYGNAHSRSHVFGRIASDHVEVARDQVASLIGARAKEIHFTSGATESNNIAIKGVAKFYRDRRERNKKNHLVTTVTEHKCVLDSCRALEQDGFEVTYLPVQQNGLVDMDQLRGALRPDTVMVSVMAVNNEIGVIQPLHEIGALCRERGVFFHTDAAQAAGKIELDVDAMNIDLMSLSGHKLYGPKGIGALYRRMKPRVKLEPQMSGGGQERGLRSGTLPTTLCIGFGRACELGRLELARDAQWTDHLSRRLMDGISRAVPNIVLNGDADRRYSGNLNLSFAFVEGESLLLAIRHHVALSSGSACTSASLEPSYVLRALGVQADMAHTSLRFGLGRFTTQEEVDTTIRVVVDAVNKLREMSPLYDLYLDGIDVNSIQWTEDH